MLKLLKKYFIPHRENDYKPHFFREANVLTLAFVIVFFFLVSLLQGFVLTQTDFFAAVVPSVLVDLANQNRLDNELPPLAMSSVLQEVAEAKARDMAENGYFAHTSPEGITPWHWFYEAGYKFSFAGENLAVNFSDSFDVTRAWMVSPGHRANILNLNFTEIGIATAQGIYQGRETTFVVQVFGKPSQLTNISEVVAGEAGPPQSSEAGLGGQPGQEAETVAGSASPETLQENLKIVAQDDMFIGVQNLDQVAPEGGKMETRGAYASWLDKLLSSPKAMLTSLYAFLASLILIALMLMVFVEIRQQHPLHILYGFLLLVLIGTLVYSQKAILLSQTAIL